MATRTHITLVCDLCGHEDVEGGSAVSTHVLEVDGQGVEAEVCKKCWKPLDAAFTKLRGEGRATGRAKSKRRSGGKLVAV